MMKYDINYGNSVLSLPGAVIDRLKDTAELELKVLIYYLDGYSYQQIGEKIDKDAKAVDNAIQRIKKKIESII